MALFQTRLFLRIIAKGREVYLLKIVTLAIAFACSTLILVFAISEFGYDRFHQDHNAIFRLLRRNNGPEYSGNRLSNRVPVDVYKTLKAKSRDSLLVSRIKLLDELNISAGGLVFRNQKIHVADPAITDIFTFNILDGSLTEFEQRANTIILSSSTAIKYFGTARATAKKLKVYTLGDTVLFSVAAVYDGYPQNSHEAFNGFIRFDTASIQALQYDHEDIGIYGKLVSADKAYVAKELNQLAEPEAFSYQVQRFPEIYFGPRVIGEDVMHGDLYSIVILICITALIFFLALTNFINLTTLTLPYRSKELAVKKLAGTSQWSLTVDFAKESFSIVGISLALGILILVVARDFIEAAIAADLFSLLRRGDVLLILIVLSFILGVAPLFMTVKFTSATPNRLLSTATITFPRFKRIIIFLQLGISIFLIVASMVIKRQVNYSLLKEPGRNHDQVVYLHYPNNLSDADLRNLRATWKRINPNIIDIIGLSQLPNQIKSKELNSDFYFVSVDPAFSDFFDLKMIDGNWFKANDGDSIVVVNEAGREMLKNNLHNVIGVFEDWSGQFNQPEKPVKINIAPSFSYNYLCVRVLEVDIRRTVRFLSDYFEQGTQKASIFFLNKRFEGWLNYQDRLNMLSEILAIISGLLSCLAIYGLSVSMVRDKIKQIAIHKLCGASVLNITRLLVKEFAYQLLMAVVIFGPITYIVLKELLRGFIYATHFIWMDPLVPLAYCAIVITMLCGFQALNLNRADLSSALKG